MPKTRERLVVELGIAAAAAFVLWRGVHTEFPVIEIPAAHGAMIAAVLGLLARASARFERIASGLSVAAALLAIVLLCRDLRWAWTWERDLLVPAWLAAASVAAPTIVAIAGLTLRNGAAAFVTGCGAAALSFRWSIPIAPVVALVAFASMRELGSSTDENVTTRHRVALVGLGALAILSVVGVLHDLTAQSFPAELRRAEWPAFSVSVDGPASFGLRFAGEALVVVGAWAFARGRTAGLLAVAVAGPILLATLVGDAITRTGTGWGGGCMGWPHPLIDYPLLMAPPLVFALAPWLGPLWRSWRSSSPAARG